MTRRQLKARLRRAKYLRVKHVNQNLPMRIRRGYPDFRDPKVCKVISKVGYSCLIQHTPLRIKQLIKK